MEKGLSFYWFNDQQAIEEKESKIWLLGLDSGETFDSIDEAFDYLLESDESICYVENLDFFTSYTIDFCERNHYTISKGKRGILKKEKRVYSIKKIGDLISSVSLKNKGNIITFKSPIEVITKNRKALKELMEQDGLDVSKINEIKIMDPVHRTRKPTEEERESAVAEAKGILYFKETLEKEFPGIVDHSIATYTMSHLIEVITQKTDNLAYKRFREIFPILGAEERQFYQNMREYTFKGMMFCGMSHPNAILKYDRNNMYPYIMSIYEFPCGVGKHYTDGTMATEQEFGFYKLDELELSVPYPLPGIEGEVVRDYIISSPLFDYLNENDLIINEPHIIESYIYEKRRLSGALGFFRDLYDRKIQFKKEGKFFLTDLLKQMSVVCYGKWSQCGYNEGGKDYDKPGFYEYLPVGVATVQYAWLDVLKIINHPDLDILDDIIYIDTDCVVYNKAKKAAVEEVLGNKIGFRFGQWKPEADTDKYMFYGIKQYRYYDYEAKEEVDKMAGLGQLQTQEDWLETLDGVEHRLRFKSAVKGGKIYISQNREVKKNEKR